MGVAIFTEKCPQCGGVLWISQHTTLGHISTKCESCGMEYEEMHYPKEYYDEMIVEGAYEEVDYEDYWKEKGYGVVCIALKDGGEFRERIKFPYEEKKINEYLALFEQDEVDADKSYLTLWDEKNQKVVSVFGPMPPDFTQSIAF